MHSAAHNLSGASAMSAASSAFGNTQERVGLLASANKRSAQEEAQRGKLDQQALEKRIAGIKKRVAQQVFGGDKKEIVLAFLGELRAEAAARGGAGRAFSAALSCRQLEELLKTLPTMHREQALREAGAGAFSAGSGSGSSSEEGRRGNDNQDGNSGAQNALVADGANLKRTVERLVGGDADLFCREMGIT